MSDVRETIRKNLEKLFKDYSYRELSARLEEETGLKVAYSTLQSYVKGDRVPRPEIIEQIANFFRRDIDWFYADHTSKGWVPVVGSIQAGKPLIADENIIDWEEIPKTLADTGDYFYLKVDGDSMINAHIPPGSLVLIKKQNDVDSGDIAAVMVNAEDATIKRVVKTNGNIVLQPENSLYKPIVIDPNQRDFRIIGKVIEIRIRV